MKKNKIILEIRRIKKCYALLYPKFTYRHSEGIATIKSPIKSDWYMKGLKVSLKFIILHAMLINLNKDYCRLDIREKCNLW